MYKLNFNMKTALLAGASGLIGKFCLGSLLKDINYKEVIILVRKKMDLENSKLRQVIVNFEKLEDSKEYMKSDDVYCCLGSTIKRAGTKAEFYKVDFTYVLELAKVSLKLGAKQFSLVSSVGAGKKSKNFYLKTKGEIEEAVIALGFETTNIFRPSFLLGERKEKRPGEKFGILASKILSPLMAGPLKKYKPVEAKAVAEVMVYIANHNYRSVNYFSSDVIKKIYTENIL